MSTFEEILARVTEVLQHEERVPYRALKRRFNLDDEFVEDLKVELIDAKRLAIDEDSKVLVWTGTSLVSGSTFQVSVANSRVGLAHHDVTVTEAGTVGAAHPTGEEEAEACFLKAIEIARHRSAKSWELRAVLSLSRLWQQQGKRGEAYRLLAETYGWFTEGFDTKDLQEADALLEELT